MYELSAPIRPGDLINSRQARLQWVEELVALDRLQLSNIEPFEWGFWLKLNRSERFLKWWIDRSPIEHLFLLEARELDRYGTYLVLSRHRAFTPQHAHAAICSWNDLPKAAEYLRTSCIGPLLWETYGPPVLSVYTQQILAALAIREQPLNSPQLPSYSEAKWGTLLRLDQGKSKEALVHLCIEKPSDCSVPFLANLGANVFAVLAWSPLAQEPLRIGLCRHWNDDLAVKDLARWLKSFGQHHRCLKATNP
jgi:hypothetical protein